jgi:hypothetical protein
MTKLQFDSLLKQDPCFQKLVDGLLVLARKYLKLQHLMLEKSSKESKESKEEDFDVGGIKFKAFLEIVKNMNPYLELQMKEKGQQLMLNYLEGKETNEEKVHK